VIDMAGNVTGGLTAAEEQQLLDLLARVGQPYSMRFFEALTDVLPVVAFEAVILRMHEGRRQILLEFRHGGPDNNGGPDDKWPDCWTVPGTVLRLTDATLDAVMDRLAKKELGIDRFETWRCVGQRLLHGKAEHGRAQALQMVHIATIPEGQETKGRWFDLDDLPSNFLHAQQSLIQFALDNE
jgi:ADP-ribose pyrophosphatase YjhB (NUDIX family)